MYLGRALLFSVKNNSYDGGGGFTELKISKNQGRFFCSLLKVRP